MSEGDGRTTVSNGLPWLAEISRAVTRGIRGLAEVASAPSFAASLASASAAVDGDDPALQGHRRKLPALFAASRGTLEARRA